ncbi:MAG: transcription factor S [Candidatus Asgardarchaeia archaeon]
MEFCPKCGSLLLPKKNKEGKNILVCTKCGSEFEMDFDVKKYKIEKRIEHTPKEETIVLEEEPRAYPTENVMCPKCGYNEAYVIEVQTIDAEEDKSAVMYRCRKCGHTWREY